MCVCVVLVLYTLIVLVSSSMFGVLVKFHAAYSKMKYRETVELINILACNLVLGKLQQHCRHQNVLF